MAHDDPSLTIENPSDLPGASMSAVIGFDCPCEVCNYNNRGLAIGSVCPECGASIRQTVGNIRLIFQPIWWLRRLLWGSRLIATGATIVLLAVFLAVASAFMQLRAVNFLPGPIYILGLLLLWNSGAMILATGWLVLTWSTPFAMSRRTGAESATRIFAMMISASTCVAICVFGVVFLTPLREPGVLGGTLIALGGSLAIFCTPLLLITGLVYLAAIALRIPSRSLTRNCSVIVVMILITIVTWIVTISIYGGVVAGLESSLYGQPPPTTGLWIAYGIGWSLTFGTIGGYTVLLWCFSVRFKSVLTDAMARQEPPPADEPSP